MNQDLFIRRALWIAAVFNVGGAYLFALPASALGQLVGLPTDVPMLYRALMVVFVLLFGGSYAWLASQSDIHRPWLAFGAIGKASAFLVVFLLWLASQASVRSVLVISGDLVLAGIFAGWLAVTSAVAKQSS